MSKINYRAILLIWLGFCFVFDGLLSLAMYRDQTWYEQAFRVGRMIGGILVTLLAPSAS